MFFTVLALPVVLTQILVLLMVIAIESIFFHKFLKFTPKNSVQYVATINLLSAIVGWLIFLGWEEIISTSERERLMSCVFFNQCQFWGFLSFLFNFVIFFCSFLWKWLAFQLLMVLWLRERKLFINSPLPPKLYVQLKKRIRILSDGALIIFLAHFISYPVIVFALIIHRSSL
ncbi:MAG: hypothetical protein RLZZ338_2389 [Cyanobacteriota bacterium]|jgi:hypothetical protein